MGKPRPAPRTLGLARPPKDEVPKVQKISGLVRASDVWPDGLAEGTLIQPVTLYITVRLKKILP